MKKIINCIENFKTKKNMYIDSNYRLIIHGDFVSEFNFMLRNLSQNKIKNFDNFEIISNNKNEILNNADLEIDKIISKKQFKNRFENPSTIERFKNYIDTIDEFVNLYKKLGINEKKARELL